MSHGRLILDMYGGFALPAKGGGHNFLKETKRGAKSVGGEKNQFDQIFKGV